MIKDIDPYDKTGVDYKQIDPAKIDFQKAALTTSKNMNRFGFEEISGSRGESAFVWKEGESYRAMVIEGLGTKIIVAEEMRKLTGKNYYRETGQDTLAMVTNDLSAMGASPLVVMAYFGTGLSSWFSDVERRRALAEGFAGACNLVGATWEGGESPSLKSIIYPDTADLIGSAVGIIKSEQELISSDKIKSGDAIVMIESSGIHANGSTSAKEVADMLPNGFLTILPNGESFGEVLLTPTHLYTKLIEDIFSYDISIHSIQNITGHGIRKLMRPERDLTYILNKISKPHDEFLLIQETKNASDKYMYSNFNMGMGYAIIVDQKDIDRVINIATANGYSSWNAGVIKEGEKKIVIESIDVEFTERDLEIR